jgi:hypothetical protein
MPYRNGRAEKDRGREGEIAQEIPETNDRLNLCSRPVAKGIQVKKHNAAPPFFHTVKEECIGRLAFLRKEIVTLIGLYTCPLGQPWVPLAMPW